MITQNYVKKLIPERIGPPPQMIIHTYEKHNEIPEMCDLMLIKFAFNLINVPNPLLYHIACLVQGMERQHTFLSLFHSFKML